MRGIDLEVLTAYEVSIDVDRKLTTWRWLQLGMLPHPCHHQVRLDEVRENHFGRRFNIDGRREVSHRSLLVQHVAGRLPQRLA